MSCRNADAAVSLENADATVSLENADTTVSLENADATVSLENADATVSLENADATVSLKNADVLAETCQLRLPGPLAPWCHWQRGRRGGQRARGRAGVSRSSRASTASKPEASCPSSTSQKASRDVCPDLSRPGAARQQGRRGGQRARGQFAGDVSDIARSDRTCVRSSKGERVHVPEVNNADATVSLENADAPASLESAGDVSDIVRSDRRVEGAGRFVVDPVADI